MSACRLQIGAGLLVSSASEGRCGLCTASAPVCRDQLRADAALHQWRATITCIAMRCRPPRIRTRETTIAKWDGERSHWSRRPRQQRAAMSRTRDERETVGPHGATRTKGRTGGKGSEETSPHGIMHSTKQHSCAHGDEWAARRRMGRGSTPTGQHGRSIRTKGDNEGEANSNDQQRRGEFADGRPGTRPSHQTLQLTAARTKQQWGGGKERRSGEPENRETGEGLKEREDEMSRDVRIGREARSVPQAFRPGVRTADAKYPREALLLLSRWFACSSTACAARTDCAVRPTQDCASASEEDKSDQSYWDRWDRQRRSRSGCGQRSRAAKTTD